MTIEVIWGSGSPYAWRVLLTLEVKGLAYESRLIQFSKGEQRTPEHLALNPRGKVPVLRDGDYVLSESLAIMAYLDRRQPEPPLFGHSAAETGLVWKAIAEFESYIAPALRRIVVPVFLGQPLDAADLRAAAGEVDGEFRRLA
jgi:glutathione S-transferase